MADPPDPTSTYRGPGRLFLLAIFAFSGAVALVYEVVWSRALLLLLGSTAAASSLVVALFVAGLGLGARWGGQQVRWRSPLRLYAFCEVGAAVWAALALPLLALLDAPYVAVAQHGPWLAWLLRIALAALVVLPSSFLLGATLPALVAQWVRRSGTAATGTAWLYGVNALGAAVGALLPAWWAIERFGVRGTIYGAAVFGLLIGALAWVRAGRETRQREAVPTSYRLDASVAGLALGAGALGLCVEVVGFRILVFFLEGFTVTLAAMLATFVLGLAAGSLTLGPALVRRADPRRALAFVLAVEGLVLFAIWFGLVPAFESWMGDVKRHWFEGATTPSDVANALKGAGLVGALTLLFVPAFFLGPTFALCVRIAEQRGASAGDAVGSVYLYNAAGSLLGPIVATFLLIPLVGVGPLWVVLAAGSLVWAAALWFRGGAIFTGQVVIAGSVLVAASFVYGPSLIENTIVLKASPGRQLIDKSSDATTTASVVQLSDGERLLYTDDFPAAAVGRHYRYMRMLGLLPCLLAENPRRTMVIAYGTGTTAGAVAEMPGVESIEVVEVSRAVLDLAPHFTDVNKNVLADKRTRVIHDDGRNALRLHAADLDVITLEPLMPYSPAGLPFYTQEFYELARDRLRDGGVLCQWVPVHAMPAELYAAFLRTFFEVFPDGTLWFFEQSTALIAHKGAGRPTAADVEARVKALHAPLSDAGLATPESLAVAYLAGGRDVLAAPTPDRSPALDATRVVRDLDPYPEFFPTPRARLSTPYLAHTLEYLATLVDENKPPAGAPWWPARSEAESRSLRSVAASAMAARWQDALAETLSLQIRARPPGHPDIPELRDVRREALKHAAKGYATVRAALPDDPVFAWRHVRTLRRHATTDAMNLLGRARVAPTPSEGRQHALLAARALRAALPPWLPDDDPVASERGAALHVYVAALLAFGRCTQALREAERLAPGTPGADELVAALRRLADGAPAADLAPRWVFRGAAACSDEEEQALVAEFDAVLNVRPVETLRRKLKGLSTRAQRDLLMDALRTRARAWEVDTELRLVRAGLLDRCDGRRRHLLDGFEDPATAARALHEAALWGVANRYADRFEAFATSRTPALRIALANAAAVWTARPIQRPVIELLADADKAVRQAAWTALLPHAKDILELYRPGMSAAERRPLLEQLRLRFAPFVEGGD